MSELPLELVPSLNIDYFLSAFGHLYNLIYPNCSVLHSSHVPNRVLQANVWRKDGEFHFGHSVLEITFETVGWECLEGRLHRAGGRDRSGLDTKIWN